VTPFCPQRREPRYPKAQSRARGRRGRLRTGPPVAPGNCIARAPSGT